MATTYQVDPSKTLTLRRRYLNDMKQRFSWMKRQINQLVGKDDAFGLKEEVRPNIFNRYREFAFLSSTEKIAKFKEWLQEQIDAGILTTDSTGNPWQNTYIESAYRKGYERSYYDVNKAGLLDDDNFFAGKKAQWMSEAFSSKETVDKLGLLYTRAYDALEGVTDAMSNEMGRILAIAIANGQGPAEAAKQMLERIDVLTNKRAFAIARTETIRSHAYGQLSSLERLGIDEVEAMVEFSTAGDDRVCSQCAALEGVIFEVKYAYEEIPKHVSCRCAWKPVIEGKRFRT